MACLLDTNIFLRLAETESENRKAVLGILRKLRSHYKIFLGSAAATSEN